MMSFPSWAAVWRQLQPNRQEMQLEVTVKKGDISMHGQKSHSPEAPGEEGGRNHNHPYNFLPYRK